MRVDTGRLRVVAHDAAEAEALPPTPDDDRVAAGVAPRADGLPSPGAYIEAQRLRRGMSIEQLAAVTKIPARSLRLLEADRFDELPGQVFVKGFLRCCARSLGVSQQAVMDLLYERERAALLKRRRDRGGDRASVPAAPAQTYEGDDDDGAFDAHGLDAADEDLEDDLGADVADDLEGDVDDDLADSEGDPESARDPGFEGERGDPAAADTDDDLAGVEDDLAGATDDDHGDDDGSVAAGPVSSPEALRAATRARRQAEAAAKAREVRTRRGKHSRGKRGPAQPTSPRYPRRGGAPRTAPANEVGPRQRPPRVGNGAPRAGVDAFERLRTLVPSTHALLWIVVAIFVAFLVLAAFNLAGTPVGMRGS